MEERKGRDMAKVAIGLLLIVIGNFVALKAYPKLSNTPPPSAAKNLNGASIASQYWAQSLDLKLAVGQVSDLDKSLAAYFRFLLMSLGMVSLGAYVLYSSASTGSASESGKS